MRVFWGLPHMGWRSVRDSRTLSKLMCGIGKLQPENFPARSGLRPDPANPRALCARAEQPYAPKQISELQLHLPSFGRCKSTRITRGGGRNYRDETMKPPWLQQPLYLHYLALSCGPPFATPRTQPPLFCRRAMLPLHLHSHWLSAPSWCFG